MGILIVDSLTVNATGVQNTNTYCSFGKSTIKIKRDLNQTTNDTHLYIAHGIARMFYSMQDRKDEKDPIKEYFINVPDVSLDQINDANLYTILYDKLKLETDFVGKTILDIPYLTFNLSSTPNISISEGTVITGITNSSSITSLEYGISHAFSSSVLGEDPQISFTELHLSPDFIGLSGTRLILDVDITTGITTTANIVSDPTALDISGEILGLSAGITDRHISVQITSKNPDSTGIYDYIINPI